MKEKIFKILSIIISLLILLGCIYLSRNVSNAEMTVETEEHSNIQQSDINDLVYRGEYANPIHPIYHGEKVELDLL